MDIYKMLYHIKHGWITIGLVLGRVMNPIIMTVFYILIIVPLALLSRLFLPQKQKGYLDRNHLFTPSDFEKLW